MKKILHSLTAFTGTVVFWSVAWAGVMNFVWELLYLDADRMTARMPNELVLAMSEVDVCPVASFIETRSAGSEAVVAGDARRYRSGSFAAGCDLGGSLFTLSELGRPG